MKYYSTQDPNLNISLREAVIQGLAPDGGLFMPEELRPFSASYFNELDKKTFQEISFDVARQLIGDELSPIVLERIVERSITFDAPLVEVGQNTWALELFHGPTLAFKDYGARFLAGLMEYFAADQEKEIVVLAATSGDTGSAVANGFRNAKGVSVIILYPSQKVSPLQEKQLTTLGNNITAWEVEGSFDDCQRLVKQIFLDNDLRKKFLLTSANSINLGRLLPQTFYYFYAWSQLKKNMPVVFSVPSGNFGNLTAGVLAKRLGLPISKFVAATNANDAVPTYLISGVFSARPSVQTVSNAMDVGNPSNFARLLDLYDHDHQSMAREIVGYAFSDDQTQRVITQVYASHQYLLDPHGAVGYLGIKKYMDQNDRGESGIFFETAHPGKFAEVVEHAIQKKIELPEKLSGLKYLEKRSILVSKKFEDAKERLCSMF